MELKFKNVAKIIFLSCLLAIFCTLPGCSNERDLESDKRARVTWMLDSGLDQAMYKKIADDFRKLHPEIKLEILWVPANQYQVKFKTLAASGMAPDLFICGDVWVAYLHPFLRDITEFVERDAEEIELDDFYPELLKACQMDGRYYFMPRFFNVSLLYFNVNLIREAKVPFPSNDWTWDDYINASSKMMSSNAKGQVNVWGSDIILGWWGEWLIQVRQAGGDMFNKEISACTLDTPEAIRGMQFYYDKIYKHKISPLPGYGPGKGFISNKIALQWGGHTGNWKIFNEIANFDWDIALLPKGPTGERAGEIAIDAFGISKTSKSPESAWKLLKFICSKEGIRRHVVEGRYISVRKSVTAEVYENSAHRLDKPVHWQLAYEAIKDAKPIPQSPDFIEIALEIIQPEIDLMVSGSQTPEEACRKAAKAANEFIRTISTTGGSDQ